MSGGSRNYGGPNSGSPNGHYSHDISFSQRSNNQPKHECSGYTRERTNAYSGNTRAHNSRFAGRGNFVRGRGSRYNGFN